MTDRNLLDELMKLLSRPGPVNWALAEQLAGHVSGEPEPIDPWIADEYLELARLAQLKVPATTGLATDPTLEPVLVGRKEWAKLHLRSFRYLVDPMADRLDGMGPGPLGGLMKPLGPVLLGMSAGALAGTLSTQALGSFDTGLPVAEPVGITYHIPNIEGFATEHSLDPRQVRLWVAFHESVHEALLGRPWVRPHLIELFGSLVTSMELDTGALGIWQEALADPARLEEAFGQPGGMNALLGGGVDEELLEEAHAAMTMVEGYGAYLVEQASTGLLPDLAAIRAAMTERLANRQDRSEFAGTPRSASSAGVHGKGTEFCAEVGARWGPEAVRRIWEGPDRMPSPRELDDVTGWAARVLLDDPFTG
jgi:putative hydrolase